MSHQVQINYRQIAVQCLSVCEVAETQLKAIDDTIANIAKAKEHSRSLLGKQTASFEDALLQERTKLADQISAVKLAAEEQRRSNMQSQKGDILAEARRLQARANVLASEKLVEFNGLLDMLLSKSISDNYEKLKNGNGGTITITDSVQALLDGIADDALRQFTYIAYINDTSLSGEALLNAGKALIGQTYESRLESEKQKIRAELEAARVERGTIDKVMAEGKGTAQEQLSAIRTAASNEIVGEKVRQKSLKIIMQAIQARGFVVDKKNIKIRRDTNEVVLVALKASGEKAEFRVFLDGKFTYDFRGYEGQACQKDIEPFMHDLEEVYGVKVTSQQTIWSNPDKIASMKYQAIKTNKNKG